MVSSQEFHLPGGEKPYEKRGGNQRRQDNTTSSCHRGKSTPGLHKLPRLTGPSPGASKTHPHHTGPGLLGGMMYTTRGVGNENSSVGTHTIRSHLLRLSGSPIPSKIRQTC